ncbi:galactose-3-O-sulfotransferase 2-like, partial [Clarias magur]
MRSESDSGTMSWQLRHARRESNAPAWRSVPPWSACVRAGCYRHLRLIWHALTFLTVLCVALQLLSVVRQSWNSKKSQSDHQLINPLSNEQQDAQPNLEHFHSSQAAFWRFQWSDGKDKGPNEALEPTGRNLDTTSARRLASTSGRNLAPNQQARKADAAHDSEVEVVKKSQVQDLSQMRFPQFQSSRLLTSDQNGTCQPKNHIVFLKTHKTASSTILNILYRYGDTRNLTFALPVHMHSQLYYPNYFMSHFVEGVRSRRVTEFHIMCNHMRFRGTE